MRKGLRERQRYRGSRAWIERARQRYIIWCRDALMEDPTIIDAMAARMVDHGLYCSRPTMTSGTLRVVRHSIIGRLFRYDKQHEAKLRALGWQAWYFWIDREGWLIYQGYHETDPRAVKVRLAI